MVITSVGASMWGANDPEFTWLDMETLFWNEGIFHTRSQAATYGGGNDMGRGLSPEGRRVLQAAIDRNDVPLLDSDNIEEAITRRMAFYSEAARGRPYALYVNIGGGVASIGSSHSRLMIPPGLSFDLGAHNWPRKGTLVLFAEKGTPVLHLLGIAELARDHGLPVAPDYLPVPGEGPIFVRPMYRLPVAAAVLLGYCLACVLILAPEIRRGLFDRLQRRRPAHGPLLLLALSALVMTTAPAKASTRWVGTQPREQAGEICLSSSGRQYGYVLLDAATPAVYQINGPRRLKVVARGLAAAGSNERQRYTVIVTVDDREVLRKSFSADPHPDMSLCDGDGTVTALRRANLKLAKGRHRVTLTAIAEDDGQVAARLFLESRKPSSGTVPFAPETYSEVTTLQFESGKQSDYYRFESGTPLGFTVTGPTTLHVYTRLDFDQTMKGSQEFSLEVLRDGEHLRDYSYHTGKLATAFYTDRPELLPGSRKKLTLTVPAGRHYYEIRCRRPEACGIAARIRLPKSDLEERR